MMDGDHTPRGGETDRKKIYAGKTAVRSIYEELFRPGKTVNDWLKLIPQVCWISSEAKTLIDEVLLNGTPKGSDEKTMIARLLVQFSEKLNNMDNLTKVGAMSYTEELYEPYFWFAPEFYMAGFRNDGICAGVSGNLGSGKTHWTWKIIEMALDMGYRIVTNMWFDKEASREAGMDVDKVDVVKYFSDTMNLLSGHGRKLLVLDEVSQFFDRKTAMAKENIELEHFLRLMRKMKTSAVFIEQDPGRYPTLFEYFMSVYFFKPSKKRLEITVNQPNVKIHRFVDGVPMTMFVWDTYHPASFFIDVSMSGFNDMLVTRDTFKMEDLPEMVESLRTPRPGDSEMSVIKDTPLPQSDPVLEIVNKISEMSKVDRDRLKGKRGNFDWTLVAFDFDLSNKQAMTVANVLDRDARLPQGDVE